MNSVSKIGVTLAENNCPTIELFIPPFITDVGNTAVLNIDGITNTSPIWNTWEWQVAVNYLPTPVPNPTWVTSQIGGLTYTIGTDDTVVRVVLNNGNCTYYSNESGYEKPIPCGNVRLEAFNYDVFFEIFPIIENDVPGVSTSGHPNYAPNSFVFQRLGGTAPNFTWVDTQTGEDPASNILKYVSPTEDYYRIKYISPLTGCIYYSNIVRVIFP